MGDAFVSAVANRLIDEIINNVGNEINLVWGVKEELRDLATKLEAVTNILDDADKQGFTNQSTKTWLKRLEELCYEMEDVLDEWKYFVRELQMDQSEIRVAPNHKVCCFIPSPSSCLPIKRISTRRHIAKKIEQVKKQLRQILEEKDQYNFLPIQPTDKSWRVPSTSFVKEVDILGRDIQKEMLLNSILDDQNASREQSSLQVISIVGLGGIGKTTLAQLIYNDTRVLNCYPLKMWICVSDPFDTETIARRILDRAIEFRNKEKLKENPPDTRQLDLESLLQRLRNSIEGQKFLLILDDVWDENSSKWEPLRNCLEVAGLGSKILVTTRKENVARMMSGSRENDMHQIELLSNEDCWSILSRIALPDLSESDREKFKKIGMEIADKCRGLPLAAKTLGSLLLQRGATLNEWDAVAKSDMWKLEQAEVDLFPHLALSYNELSPTLKRCFSYCAIFPKDHDINVHDLIRTWLALGYLGSEGELEQKGHEYFNILAMHSLFQEFRMDKFTESVIVSCKMHDIIHDFATFIKNNQTSSTGQGATCKKCSPSLVSCVQEYRSLFSWHEPPRDICDCLAKVKVLYLKLSFSSRLEKLIHLRYLYLVDVDEITADICRLYNLETLVLRDSFIVEIPVEIGNLIELRDLDLKGNRFLKALPETVCDLHELRSLNIESCISLSGLPEGFNKLKYFKHLHVDEYTFSGGKHCPDEVIGQLSGLYTLRWFHGKSSMLQNLDQLRGSLKLRFKNDMNVEEDVIKAKGAQLNKKEYLNHLAVLFDHISVYDGCNKNAEGVLDDLEPHPNLSHLQIENFAGSKLSNWISMPFNQLKTISLWNCLYLTSLPPLGKLLCLEQLELTRLTKLKFVGQEFLGITTSSASVGSSLSVVGFPKLKKLVFNGCYRWEEWEDITNGDDIFTAFSLFPCLHELTINKCPNLRVLPHGLLRKALALRHVYLYKSGIEKEDVHCCGNGGGLTLVDFHWTSDKEGTIEIDSDEEDRIELPQWHHMRIAKMALQWSKDEVW